MKPVQLSHPLYAEQLNVKNYAHTQPFGGEVEVKTHSRMCSCVFVCLWAHIFLFLLMREYDLISTDIFFLQRPFISHPAPPLNTSLIVPIDCSAAATRRHNRLTYGSALTDWAFGSRYCSHVIGHFTVSRITLWFGLAVKNSMISIMSTKHQACHRCYQNPRNRILNKHRYFFLFVSHLLCWMSW